MLIRVEVGNKMDIFYAGIMEKTWMNWSGVGRTSG